MGVPTKRFRQGFTFWKGSELVEEGQIPPLKVGIGLNSGNILADNIGNSQRKAYSLTGKNVIIAARIEPLNKKFQSQLLVSECVLEMMQGDQPKADDLGIHPLKGIEKPVRIFQLK